MATIRERISRPRSPRSKSRQIFDRSGKRSHPDPERSRGMQTYDSTGMRLTYAYDSIGQRKSLTEPERGRFSYTYDPAGRISKLVNPQNQITTFLYDSASRRTATILANGTRASYSYDSANNQLSVANIGPGSTILSSLNYTYDPVGNRQRVIEASGNRVTWTYDKTYQLTNEQRSGSNSYNITYTYDPVGNRLAKIAGGVPTTNTYDVANELVTSESSNGTTTNTWDANGNLLITSAPSNQLTTYMWDFENRITRAALPSGIVDTFEYDGDGKRVQKVDSSGTSNFLWDGENILLETDSSNIIQVVYSLEPRFYGNLIFQWRNGIGSYYLFDSLGSTTQLTNSTGSVTDYYIYEAYGDDTYVNGQTVNFFRFEGKVGYYFNIDLFNYYLRARYLDSQSGIFLIRDPIGNYSDGRSFYIYCSSNPINSYDPSGLQNSTDVQPPDNWKIISNSASCSATSMPLIWRTSQNRAEGVLFSFVYIPKGCCFNQFGADDLNVINQNPNDPNTLAVLNKSSVQLFVYFNTWNGYECDAKMESELADAQRLNRKGKGPFITTLDPIQVEQPDGSQSGKYCFIIDKGTVHFGSKIKKTWKDCSSVTWSSACAISCKEDQNGKILKDCCAGVCQSGYAALLSQLNLDTSEDVKFRASWQLDLQNKKECSLSPCKSNTLLEQLRRSQ